MDFLPHMPIPDLSPRNNPGYSTRVLNGYLSYVTMWKQANAIQIAAIDQGGEAKNPIHYWNRDNIQEWCPPDFCSSDINRPSSDFLSARLFAKYWESEVLIYRPYIHEALHWNNGHHDRIHELGTGNAWMLYCCSTTSLRSPDPRVLGHARRGINALIASIKAFHGLDKRRRLLVTNIFTTALA